MPKTIEPGRTNQRHRTRKDLLAAAGRLLKQGCTPDMDEVAREAMVSRATAYRYFPTIEQLLVEAPLDGEVPDPHEVFAGDPSTDPADRVDRAEAALHEMVYRNATQLRGMLAASLLRSAKESPTSVSSSSSTAARVPLRQNRRTPLIEAALAPARDQFTPAAYRKLCAALALIFGVESMIVFTDVLGIDERTARKIKSWAATALVEAARGSSSAPLGRR